MEPFTHRRPDGLPLVSALLSGEFEKAIELYDALIKRKPDHAESYYKRANAHNGLARWQAALADYDKALALDPQYANAFCNRGAALEHLGLERSVSQLRSRARS